MNKHLIPSFFIIGERKCGSSSLFRYLVDHPRILPGRVKEPNFFIHDIKYITKHFDQYLMNFPLKRSEQPEELDWPELNENGILFEEKIFFNRNTNTTYITGEASANTYFDVPPHIIKRFLPQIKLILLVRNPVDRAYSHFRMYERFVAEGRDIGWNLGSFEDEVSKEIQDMKKGKWGYFISPSCYAIKFREWKSQFNPNQLRVFDLSDFATKKKANQTMNQICDYLEIESFQITDFRMFNKAPKSKLSPTIRKDLMDFFKPYNRHFFDYLGKSFIWE